MKKDPIVYIEEYIKRMSYIDFEENYAIQDAVLRRLQIIAEAAKRIDVSIKTVHPYIPWTKKRYYS